METLPQGSERPVIWVPIMLLTVGSMMALCNQIVLGAAVFVTGIYSLARTKRFRWWWVVAISFGAPVLAAAILLGGALAFIMWATGGRP
jgi:energy-converting hydrogenase Eha subunit A